MKTAGRTWAFAVVPAVVLVCLTEAAAQGYWYYLKNQALRAVERQGESVLRNDAINFMKVADPRMGYRLAPNLDVRSDKMAIVTTRQGFFQREPVAVERKPGSFRLIVLGDSPVMGHDVDRGNFPAYLRRLVADRSSREYPGGTEVINAGVAGYISDQTALWADAELADYRPDVVVMYAGFNDFQSYAPCEPPADVSYFETFYGKSGQFAFLSGLKSVVFARAWISKFAKREAAAPTGPADGPTHAWMFREWQPELGASVSKGAPAGDLPRSTITIPPGGYAWTAARAAASSSGRYVASMTLGGEGVLTLRLNGSEKPWPAYDECQVRLTPGGRTVECGFTKPADGMGVQLSLMNKSTAPVVVSAVGVNAHRPGEQPTVVDACTDPYPPDQVYAFFLRSLDHTVDSFRRKNPRATVVISTLVGRWPMDTQEQFERPDGHVWWMKVNNRGRQDAAAALDRFNALIRRYGESRHFIVVDMSQVFAGLDRQKLMWSFAHMTNEGYEIMARTIDEALPVQHRVAGQSVIQ